MSDQKKYRIHERGFEMKPLFIPTNRKLAKAAVTDLVRVYINVNGDPVSLIQLIKEQPEWAKLHINNLEHIIETLDNKLKRIKELVK